MAATRIELRHESLALVFEDDGLRVTLHDVQRDCAWHLSPQRRHVRFTDASGKSVTQLLPPGQLEQLSDTQIRATHVLPQGRIILLWSMARDHVCVDLESAPLSIAGVSLPGAWTCDDAPPSLLLPPYQGVLYRPTGRHFEGTAPGGGGHGNFSLSMAATLARRAALLVTQEQTVANSKAVFGEDDLGPHVCLEQERCEVHGWTPRSIHLYPIDADITAVAKRYRRRMIERNEFVTWEQKIAAKPILNSLFGALMAFTGYNADPNLDYANCARQLHDMGFSSVLYFPVRMCHYSLDFLMGGDRPIWLSDEQIAAIRAVPGAKVGPWGWYIEALDDGSPRMAQLFSRRRDGSTYNNWRIEEQQWKLVCVGEQITESKRRFATDMAAMDWIHYDVNATRLGREVCHATGHASHLDGALDKNRYVQRTHELLSATTNGNRIVSSEGFSDRYASSYDIGSCKLIPVFPPTTDFIPVPLTSLVLHDSCLHDWWELHNYNELPGLPAHPNNRWGWTGTGMANLKASMDALYGAPPSVFPFGRQYGWTDIGTRSTFSFSIRLEHREVKRALEAALPVTQLHARIGKLEMNSFELLSDDGSVQATTFADGTRIVANLGRWAADVPGLGRMDAQTWRQTH